jgi:hypothetical protein
MGKDAAAHVAAKLALNVARQRRSIRFARVGKEGLDRVANGPVKDRFGGAAGLIGGREASHADTSSATGVPRRPGRVSRACPCGGLSPTILG